MFPVDLERAVGRLEVLGANKIFKIFWIKVYPLNRNHLFQQHQHQYHNPHQQQYQHQDQYKLYLSQNLIIFMRCRITINSSEFKTYRVAHNRIQQKCLFLLHNKLQFRSQHLLPHKHIGLHLLSSHRVRVVLVERQFELVHLHLQ